MNERIKQLWEDSDQIHTRYPEQGSSVSVSEQTLEKFAELIINETLQIARVGMEFGPSMDEAVYTYFEIK